MKKICKESLLLIKEYKEFYCLIKFSIAFIFIFSVLDLFLRFLGFCTSYTPLRICQEQVNHVINLIIIHSDYAHELSEGIWFVRQAYFVIVTGLLFYYFVKDKSIEPNRLLLLLFFATAICHLNEGILDYWQVQHLNKVHQFEEGLEQELFHFQHISLQETTTWKSLPVIPSDFGRFISILVFIYSPLQSPSHCFFYLISFALLIILLSVDRILKKKEGGDPE